MEGVFYLKMGEITCFYVVRKDPVEKNFLTSSTIRFSLVCDNF